jgi:hypothetical protein
VLINFSFDDFIINYPSFAGSIPDQQKTVGSKLLWKSQADENSSKVIGT